MLVNMGQKQQKSYVKINYLYMLYLYNWDIVFSVMCEDNLKKQSA
jgi:hypothetical protein